MYFFWMVGVTLFILITFVELLMNKPPVFSGLHSTTEEQTPAQLKVTLALSYMIHIEALIRNKSAAWDTSGRYVHWSSLSPEHSAI